jgi:hypothetical protein
MINAWTSQEPCSSFAETFACYDIISGFYETRGAYYSWRGAPDTPLRRYLIISCPNFLCQGQ